MCECLPILLFFIRQRSLRSSGMPRGKIQTFVQIYRTFSSREEIKAGPTPVSLTLTEPKAVTQQR